MSRLFRATGILISVLVSVAGSTTTSARLWVVSNSGVDSDSCGSYAASCRTISQAIANASNGDRIAVGPGQYGNVSGNPAFGGPSDERPGPMNFSPGLIISGFTGCVLCIDKAVTITSFAGPAETVIRGNPKATQYPTVVGIEHDGVIFGAPGHGFTITGGRTGVGIAESCMVMTTNVYVDGNVATNDTTGFEFFGLDVDGPSLCPTGTAHVYLSNNTATNNSGIGFTVLVNLFKFPVTLSKNLAMGGSIGFWVDPGSQNGDLNDYAGQVTLLNNVATNNDLDIGPSAHYGLLNTGLSIFNALTPSGGKLSSLHDYWGTAAGPNAPGPGDNAGGKCDKSGAVTTVVPFSTTPYVFNSLQ